MNENKVECVLSEKEVEEDMVCSDEGLKEAINNVLWSYLPGRLTLCQAEDVACRIYEIIQEMRRRPL